MGPYPWVEKRTRSVHPAIDRPVIASPAAGVRDHFFAPTLAIPLGEIVYCMAPFIS